MIEFFNGKKYEDIEINGVKCVLASKYDESGPIFNLLSFPYIKGMHNKFQIDISQLENMFRLFVSIEIEKNPSAT